MPVSKLHYCDVNTLKKGWTLLLNTQCTSTTRSKSTTIAMECLTTNGCIEHRVKLELVSNEPFTFTITASLCYSTTHLHQTFNQLLSSAPVQQTPASLTGFLIPLAGPRECHDVIIIAVSNTKGVGLTSFVQSSRSFS